MNLDAISTAAAHIPALASHIEFLGSLAKPSVDIALGDMPAAPDTSRFGGHPYVPAGFEWPSHPEGEYRFLGQFNFAEIDNAPDVLPRAGLLALFYAYDEDGEIFWGDDGYVLGYYWDDTSDHILIESPVDAPSPLQLRFEVGVDIPRSPYMRDDWPFGEDALYDLIDALEPASEYLLGYPSFTSLSYDPTPGPEWMSLLTVHSLHQFDWIWHDGDKLMVFIESENLAAGDFNHLKTDAG